MLERSLCDEFLRKIRPFVNDDEYGKSTVHTIYYDSDNFEIIRNSIERPVYKEKLRARCYGDCKEDGITFLEIKKKYKGVGSKRRVALPLNVLNEYINNGVYPKDYDCQILREIDYLINFYKPKAKIMISCEREAFFSKTDPELRITVDSGIRSRTERLDLSYDGDMKKLFDDDICIIEIKTESACEMWLVSVLNELKMYPESFSKYGSFYKKMLKNNELYECTAKFISV